MIEDNYITCDQCGFEQPNREELLRGWSKLQVKPKGVQVELDLCRVCTKKREPKEPVPKPLPSLHDCWNHFHVAAILLRDSGYVHDVFLPRAKTTAISVKYHPTDTHWSIMQAFTDTSEGHRQRVCLHNHIQNWYPYINLNDFFDDEFLALKNACQTVMQKEIDK